MSDNHVQAILCALIGISLGICAMGVVQFFFPI